MDAQQLLALATSVAKTVLKAAPGTIGGAIAGYVTARRAEKARRADRIREEHLAELKSEFLSVLRTRIDTYYLPIATKRVGALEVSVVQINRDQSTVAESAYVRSVDRLVVVPLRSQQGNLVFHQPEIRAHSPSFERLYRDAKEVHYPQLVRRLEGIERDFGIAAQKHLEYAERLRDELAPLLPEATERDGRFNDPYSNLERLAHFIYENHLGVHPSFLLVDPNSPFEVRSSNAGMHFVRCLNKEAAERALKEIERVSELAKQRRELLEAFEPLLPRLRELRAELEVALHQNDLPAKCVYTRA